MASENTSIKQAASRQYPLIEFAFMLSPKQRVSLKLITTNPLGLSILST